MRRVIPTLDQLVVGIGPVIAVGHHRDLTRGGALHIFGELELAAVGQREPNTKVSIYERRALSYRWNPVTIGSVTKRSLIESR